MAEPIFDQYVANLAVLGLTHRDLQNKSEQERHDTIKNAFRVKAIHHHPDKPTGNTVAMQNVLKAYTYLRKTQAPKEKQLSNPYTASFFHDPKHQYTPKPNMSQSRVYEAVSPLNEIQDKFDEFTKQFADRYAFSTSIKTDPLTGQQTLTLTFPDKQTADKFIAQLLKSGMIKDIKPRDYTHTPSPFKNMNTPFNLFAPRQLQPAPINNKSRPEEHEEQRPRMRRRA